MSGVTVWWAVWVRVRTATLAALVAPLPEPADGTEGTVPAERALEELWRLLQRLSGTFWTVPEA
ncbi:hypothetical protein GCM10012278_03900 [Nonomuraea glycinis]|uniref:Uncharacterized protein n=1 Tax=Nonomuraea glycinis TaxID=2047744 RepID=A0A918A039_9ACTN|nr:hypothetical protein GCM10012278_03900 [Nonomuraea glycinis]